MKVLIVSGYYPPHIVGGGDISTRILAESLAEQGCEVHVLTCSDEPGLALVSGVAVEQTTSPNIYWRYGPSKNFAKKVVWHLLENYNPRAVFLLRSKISVLKPDIIVTSILENFGASVWLTAHEAGIPIVHILRSYYLHCWRVS